MRTRPVFVGLEAGHEDRSCEERSAGIACSPVRAVQETAETAEDVRGVARRTEKVDERAQPGSAAVLEAAKWREQKQGRERALAERD